MHYIEEPYFGDPGAMEALAARLRSTADQVGSASRGLLSRAESMDFLGPAATRFRAVVETNDSAARSVCNRAIELSHMLSRAAETARSEIAAWQRYVASLEKDP